MTSEVDFDAAETLASILAGWQAGDGRSFRQSWDGVERIAIAFGMTGDELFNDRGKLGLIRSALDDQEDNRFLPPVPSNTSRLLHSILRLPEGITSQVPVLRSIIDRGLVASPEGVGRHSEAPGLVFFVTFDPSNPGERYNKYNSWVVFDVPHDWEGWAGNVGGSFDYRWGLYDPPRPGGVVGIWNAVPPQFLVGVNGVPVDAFLRGLEFWEQNLRSDR